MLYILWTKPLIPNRTILLWLCFTAPHQAGICQSYPDGDLLLQLLYLRSDLPSIKVSHPPLVVTTTLTTTIPNFSMRYPQSKILFRIFYTFSNLTRPRAPPKFTNRHTTILKSSMSSLPFIGGFFSSSASSNKMATPVPDQRTPDEWRAVLNKGEFRQYSHT